jgi:rubrerythrin
MKGSFKKESRVKEKIDGTFTDEYNLGEILSKKKKAIKNSGIYFLIRHNRIIYVGQTTNGIKRVYEHTDKEFTNYTFIPCMRRDLNKAEAFYIKKFAPYLNIVHNGESMFEREIKKIKRDKQFKEVPNKCNDCGTTFDIVEKVCPNCGGRNIRLGGKFKVIKKQKPIEVVDQLVDINN